MEETFSYCPLPTPCLWPSHPAEPIHGIMDSDFYHKAGVWAKPGDMPAGSVHPREWADRLADLRVTPPSNCRATCCVSLCPSTKRSIRPRIIACSSRFQVFWHCWNNHGVTAGNYYDASGVSHSWTWNGSAYSFFDYPNQGRLGAIVQSKD